MLVAHAIGARSAASAHIACTRTSVGHVASTGTGSSSAVSYVPSARARTRAAIRHVPPSRRLLPRNILASIRLPIGHRVASRRTAVPVGRRPVGIGRSPTVLRIVLPITVAPGRLVGRAVAAIDVIQPIAVVDEVVVMVDVNVVIAAPAAAVAPSATPHRSHCDAHAKRNGHARRVVSRRWIRDWRVA